MSGNFIVTKNFLDMPDTLASTKPPLPDAMDKDLFICCPSLVNVNGEANIVGGEVAVQIEDLQVSHGTDKPFALRATAVDDAKPSLFIYQTS